jgi:hypothetical protein
LNPSAALIPKSGKSQTTMEAWIMAAAKKKRNKKVDKTMEN